MFVDKANIRIKAGDGGDGAVAFHREKPTPISPHSRTSATKENTPRSAAKTAGAADATAKTPKTL